MFYKNMKIVLMACSLVTLIIAGLFSPGNCFAENADPGIKRFDRPPVFNPKEMGVENLEDRMYQAMGVVDAVSDEAICIGDVPYNIEPGASVSCRVGAFVGLKLNDAGNVIACHPVRPR